MRGARAVVCLVVCLPERASAQCMTIVEQGSDAPVIEPQQRVSFALRRSVPVGEMCPTSPDAGPTGAGSSPDGGAAPTDGGVPDAAPCEVRHGDTVTMTVQPAFSTGPDGARFALVMVTPRTPVVRLEALELFEALESRTAPRPVYEDVLVEDPRLGYQCDDPKYPSYDTCRGGTAGTTSGSSGGCGPSLPPPDENPDPNPWPEWEPDDYVPPPDARLPDESSFLGPYEIAVLGVPDTAALAAWFDANGYEYSAIDLAAIAPYLERGWVAVAVRMAVSSAVDDAALEPISFTWEGDLMTLPVALTSRPGAIPLPVRAFVRAEGRFDFPGAYVPYAQRDGTAFLTRNELWTQPMGTPDQDPTAERQEGDPTFHDQETVRREIHIPVSECPRCDEEPVQDPDPPAADDHCPVSSGPRRSLCGCRLASGGGAIPGMTPPLIGFLAAMLALRRGRCRAGA